MTLCNISGAQPSPSLLLPQLCHLQAQERVADSLNNHFLAVVVPLAKCRHMPNPNRLLLRLCSTAIDIHSVFCFKQKNLKLTLLPLSHKPQEAHQVFQNKREGDNSEAHSDREA